MIIDTYYTVCRTTAGSFAKETCDRALLQKRPVILSILLTEATPYSDIALCVVLHYVSSYYVSFAKETSLRTTSLLHSVSYYSETTICRYMGWLRLVGSIKL